MLCSHCSNPISPVVALDIDGTIGDYHRHFIGFAEQYTGRQLVRAWSYNGSMSFRGWFNDTCGVGTEEYRAIKLAYRQGGMKRSMPLIHFGDSIAKLVKNMDAELWITTTRPYLSLDNIVPDTVEWLRRHEIVYDGMLFDELKYKQFAERVDPERVVLVLDDLREMCEAAEELFPGRAVQVASRFNAGDRFTVSSTLDACAEIIVGRIEDWRERYARRF
jgi:hypothetical protein